MGMFDDVICEHPLPDKIDKMNFQTKDFAREMDKYTITFNGRLLRNGDEVNFHGVLNFYGFYPEPKGGEVPSPSSWHEYNAKFTDGRLDSISVVKRD